MQRNSPSLADRCAHVVAMANQLTGYLPFTIVALVPDRVDERVGFVRIRHDEGWERESITAMPMLSPQTVAEAAIRAFVYAETFVSDGPEEDEGDEDAAPRSPVTRKEGLH